MSRKQRLQEFRQLIWRSILCWIHPLGSDAICALEVLGQSRQTAKTKLSKQHCRHSCYTHIPKEKPCRVCPVVFPLLGGVWWGFLCLPRLNLINNSSLTKRVTKLSLVPSAPSVAMIGTPAAITQRRKLR